MQASSVKRVAEFVDKHPEESVSILRSWLHERMSARARNKKAIVDATRLTGPEKAAVVLLALGEDHTTIWQALDEEEIKEISQAMAGLGTVTSARGRGPAGRVRLRHDRHRRDHGLVRADPAAARLLHAAPRRSTT